ncbi:MAG: membrane protein insertase YidC [Gemmatimonadaceae bacterium]|nr:membrane protein insertase YidC [Gemmatimonadaceae bacterium]
MERRTVVALLLVLGVILVTPKLFPSTRPRAAAPVSAATPNLESNTPAGQGSAGATAPTTAPVNPNPAISIPRTDSVLLSGSPAANAEDVVVDGPLSNLEFSTAGGSLQLVELKGYAALDKSNRHVSLSAGRTPILSFRVVADGDTVALANHVLAVARTRKASGQDVVSFSGQAGPHAVRISYEIIPDSFLLRVTGGVNGPESKGAFVLVEMPETLDSFEADTNADHGSLAYAIKAGDRGAEGVTFRSLDPGERKIIPGPITWAAAKNKYFIVGLLPDSGNQQFVEAQVTGGARTSRTPTRAHGTLVARPTAEGSFAFDLYAGPQQYQRLAALGRDFENSNPYGGWLQGVVQPFATIVMKILLWMKATLGWSYGALLVLFGVAVRLLMWPLNQGAMRTTMKMQRIQPELNAIQTKYKSDPQKLQSEMMRVYKDHNMSPFSAFAGCLPILLPMPILFALFFVFQNTIEFRGVPFLWLTDISLKDPYYIVPLLMGVSMFVLSWIGLRNSPPNPQAKMMAYVMPVMMTVLFANFASGLNLYYAVQNVAALPQQWLIANERSKAARK